MAKKQSSSKKRASGGGRAANSEPRIQQFSQFSGCNIQLSPKDFSFETPEDPSQTDLQMNYVVIQNNAGIAPNKTIETRQNIVKLFDAPEGVELTDACTLVDGELYVACDDQTVRYGELGTNDLTSMVAIEDIDDVEKGTHWTFLGYADGKLVGMTEELQLFTAPLGEHRLRNAREIPTPSALQFSQLKAMGGLAISATSTEDCPFRITLQHTHLNKYGPTLPSDPLTFWASKPTTEWSGAAYLNISGTAPMDYDIVAVELYYTEGEYQDPSFLTHVDMVSVGGMQDGGAWSFNWTGYLFDTSMWTIANLSIPTQNYTPGVPASMMTVHDGRLYFWGGDPGYRLWIGGNPGNLFSVSTGTGGGFCDVEPGSGQEIRVVPKYKTQSGNSIVTMLCDNSNSSKEHRHNLVENNVTLSNEQSAKGWQAEKVSGTVGCKSKYGAEVCADGLYAVSRYGLALTTMTMEYNSQLRVQYVSDAIEPVFTDQYGRQLSASVLICVKDILYMTFGSASEGLEHIVFCYDIDQKAWWTYTLDIEEPILNMINVDYEGHREGIGIITPSAVYLLPTTRMMALDEMPTFETLIETGELATKQPFNGKQHLTQIEFRFDYFIGDMTVELHCIDQFGRHLTTYKRIRHDELQYNLTEWMRVDWKVESYKLIFKGKANFRLVQWQSKVYPMSNKVGLVWGFDDRQSHRSHGDIHHYFKSYNDLKNAIIT